MSPSTIDKQDNVSNKENPSRQAKGTWCLPARYKLQELIGTGAYGTVWSAYDQPYKRLVAIKRHGRLFEDLVRCKRVLREVAILGRLSHHNVVRVYDIIKPEDTATFDELYFAMEICDSDLATVLGLHANLTPVQVNTLMYQLLVGLKYLHSAGIYHRDLKPSNCFVNKDCCVKIGDLGLACAIGVSHSPLNEASRNARASRCMTQHVATRWYRAPEVILLQYDYTELIDVWSAGCIYAELIQMLDGVKFEDRRPLFPGSVCYPTTPDTAHESDYAHHVRARCEQLNVIFDVLGTPSDCDMEWLPEGEAKRYIRCFAGRAGVGVGQRYTHASPTSLDLLECLVRFSPTKRTSVDRALDHVLFSRIRNPGTETTAPGYIALEFEQEVQLDKPLLRKYLIEEIENFFETEQDHLEQLLVERVDIEGQLPPVAKQP